MKKTLLAWQLCFTKSVTVIFKTMLLVLMTGMVSHVVIAQGPAGNALHFDGNNYVTGTLASNPDIPLGVPYTVEFWLNQDANDEASNILSFSNSAASPYDPLTVVAGGSTLYFLYTVGLHGSDGKASILLDDAGLTLHHWNHVAIVYNPEPHPTLIGGLCEIYVNGILRHSETTADLWSHPFRYGANTVLNLGREGQESIGIPQLVGALDEIKIWRTARTQAQILEDMTSTVANPSTNTDLLLYYNFDNQGVAGADNTGNPTANSLTDRALLGINGTLTNFSLTGNTSNWVPSYAMVIPTAAEATDTTSDGFTAHWGLPLVYDYDNFKVKVTTDVHGKNGVPGYESLSVARDASSLVITGLQPNTQYYYQVRADKTVANGVGAFSASVGAKTNNSPPIPAAPVITSFTPAYGHAGTLVTIHGSNFNFLNRVEFGGTAAASYNFVSANVITATIGSGSGGTISVSTTGGTASSEGSFFLVRELEVTSVTPSSASTGAPITIKGSGFLGASGVKLGGIVAPFFTVVDDNTISAIVGDGASGNVTVTNATDYALPAAFTYLPAGAEPGQALHFDGVDDHVTIPGNPLAADNGFTISFWMKTNQSSSGERITLLETAARGLDYWGIYMENGKLVAHMGTHKFNDIENNNIVTSTSNINTDQWVHVAVYRMAYSDPSSNPTPLKLFINGQQEAINDYKTYGLLGAGQPVFVGASPSLTPGTYFNGAMDELRFYGGLDSDIIHDMLRTEPYDGQVLSSYHFNQGVAGQDNSHNTTLFDYGPKRLFGALHNFGLSGNTSNWVESYAMVIPVTTTTTNVQPNGFTANWSLPIYGEIDNLKLTVATDPEFTQVLPAYDNKILTGTDTSLDVSGLSPLTPYYYKVQAEKASLTGQGASSPVMKFVTPSVVTSRPGNTLRFDGVDDYIRISNPGSKTFTMEFWMKTTQTGAGNPGDHWFKGTGIIDNKNYAQTDYRDFGISLLGSKLAFGYGFPNTTAVSVSDVNTGRWVHVAVIWEVLTNPDTKVNTTVTIYINGVREYTKQNYVPHYLSEPFPFIPTLTIGANNDLSHHFEGSLDELKIYDVNRELLVGVAGHTMADDMHLQPSVHDGNLWGYYTFDEGTPGQNNTGITTLFDHSLKNNNATLHNFALDGNTSNWVESYALVVPTALAATHIGGSSFTANWSAPAYGTVDHYLIDVATDEAFTNKVVSSISADGSSRALEIAGLSPLTTYYYRVVADKNSVTGEGCTGGNVISFTTTACDADAWVASVDLNGTADTDITGSCGLVATVKSQGTHAVSGYILAKVWIETTQPTNYVKRHYEITPNTSASTATGKVTLYFTQQEFDDFNENGTKLPAGPDDTEGIGHVRIEKRPGTSSDGTGLPTTYTGTPDTFKPSDRNGSVVWNATDNRWEVSFEVTGFSGFFVKAVDAALPLRLISFTGTQEAGTNKLHWQTAEEVNTDRFELERSRDARSFQQLTTVTAISSGNNSYDYIDATAYSGITYYRLKMVDNDGTFAYSRSISLSRNGKGALKLYPNPTPDQLTISVGSGLINSEAKLFDMAGRLLQTIRITTNETRVSLGTLSSGVYLIKLQDGTVESFVKN